MDFGKLKDISKVDFSLPPDAAGTGQLLRQFSKTDSLKVYVGCPIWTPKEWVGKIYPATAKEKDFLYHYTRQFNTIELNTTHYRIPDPETIIRWKAASAQGFTFCPKWPQIISHELGLVNAEGISREFRESIRGLGEHLGISFLQLPPQFSPRQAPVLAAFLEKLPADIPLAVEFRHEGWFIPSREAEDVFALLEDLKISTILTDVAGRRDALHMRLTTPTALIRFVGNGLHPSDYRRVDDWVQRFGEWFEQGLQTLYFFVHEPDNVTSPELALYLIRELNKRYKLKLAEPRITVQPIQGSLF